MTGPTTCAECVKARTPIGELTFSFAWSDLDVAASWNLARAWSIARARIDAGALPEIFDADGLRTWIAEYSDVDPAHIDHLPDDVVDTIGLAADVDVRLYAPWLDIPADRAVNTVLLDGNHRAARALRDGRPFAAYFLSDVELRSCLAHVATGPAAAVVVPHAFADRGTA